jgi:EAL domain-containing protein (putative c-di-GMP-specific phosphodiesterase class I)
VAESELIARRALDVLAVVDERQIRTLYQPIVDLDSHAVVAYEALARGPVGSDLENPIALFAAARAAKIELALDWACIESALRGAVAADLHRDIALFINVETSTVGETPPASLVALIEATRDRFRVIVEITERAVTARPAELLEHVANIRALGWGLAMDDVGVDPGSLAFLPFVRPDVVKLDMDLVRDGRGPEAASIIAAVMAHGESTGCLTLGEGIENREHLRRATGMGATLGQGWLFGRPGPLPAIARRAPRTLLATPPGGNRAITPRPDGSTPFSVVAAHRSTRVGTKELLLDISNHIEAQAENIAEHPILVGAFQLAERFTPDTRRRYERLAKHCSLVAALGIGLDAREVAGVRGAPLASDDPLKDEWSVAVVGPHYAAALVARDCGIGENDRSRLFEFVVTHDRGLVLDAMSTLLERVVRE